MKLSALEEYGLRCLVQVARHPTDRPCRIPDIAAAEGLSHDYAAKLMRVLRQGELVVSVRGASGGYLLARPAEQITMFDALVVLDGPLFTDTFCISHAGNRQDCVHDHGGCSLRAVWRDVGDVVQTMLSRVTLADLCHGAERVSAVLTSASPIPAPRGGCTGCSPGTPNLSPHPSHARDEEVR